MQKVLDRHAEMILDPLRTKPLKKAIEAALNKGDVVVDVGCGIGLLSFFACQAGAGHVYAIDCDIESLDVAKKLTKRFGFEKQITFIEDLSFLAKIDTKADLLICETVGSLAFDENIMATILDAKSRFLKPGGEIIPASLELWGALADQRITHSLFSDIEGFDVAPDNEISVPVTPLLVSPSNFLSNPYLICRADFKTLTSDTLEVSVPMEASRDGKCSCDAVWANVEWGNGFATDCSPFVSPTHWKQALLEVTPRDVKSREKYSFEFIAGPHPENSWLETETLWKLK